jgi:hypothetical protein
MRSGREGGRGGPGGEEHVWFPGALVVLIHLQELGVHQPPCDHTETERQRDRERLPVRGKERGERKEDDTDSQLEDVSQTLFPVDHEPLLGSLLLQHSYETTERKRKKGEGGGRGQRVES